MSLTARRILGFAPWLKDPLWRKAQVAPSLDLRFADNKSLVDSVSGQSLVTFSRASSATYTDSTGTLQTAATNEPRFNHNPITGESLGLLVEEQRTNSIRNNTMVGAVTGTPGTLPTNWGISGVGTLTQQIVATGVVNGINYIDIQLSGTTSTTQFSIRFETSNGASGTNGQTFTYSTWFARVAGSLNNVTNISCNANLYDAATAYITTPGFTGFDSTVQPTSLIRRAGTLTIASATSAFIQPQIAVSFNSGVAIDITLRIGLPQLEQGSFATSYIPTTTAAATRAADVASITGTAFSSWYRQDEGTMLFEGVVAPTLSRFPNEWQVSDGTVLSLIGSYNYASGYSFTLRQAGQTNTDPILSITPVSGTAYKKAAAIKASDYRVAAQGQQGASVNPAFIPIVSEIRIGAGINGVNAHNSTIRRLTYFPTRLPNTTLQRITQ
jgi:hypothetical protein